MNNHKSKRCVKNLIKTQINDFLKLLIFNLNLVIIILIVISLFINNVKINFICKLYFI